MFTKKYSTPYFASDMKGQGSTAAEISALKDAECSFVQYLDLWFRGRAGSWLGTAGELISELKVRTDAIQTEPWPGNAQAVFIQFERNADLLRSNGLEIRFYQQDNGPRLISIRPLNETSCPGSQELHSNSLKIELPNDQERLAGEAACDDESAGVWEQAEEPSVTEDEELAESADLQLDEAPSNVEENNNDQHQPIAASTDLSDWSEKHDIRNSLAGFDRANSVPTGIAQRIVITGIVILSVVGLLLLVGWLWPAYFSTARFARSTEPHSNSSVAVRSNRDADQAMKTRESTDEKSDAPSISHSELVATDGGTGGAVRIAPQGIPGLLEHSKSGDADAQYLLGRAYETGTGVEQDFVNAYAWYVISDASGNSKGKDAAKQLTPKLVPSEIASVRSKLGYLYASGAYVPKDYMRAYVWFSLAAAAGDPEGEREKTLLAQKMTEEEIAEANSRASDWLKKHEKQVR